MASVRVRKRTKKNGNAKGKKNTEKEKMITLSYHVLNMNISLMNGCLMKRQGRS